MRSTHYALQIAGKVAAKKKCKFILLEKIQKPFLRTVYVHIVPAYVQFVWIQQNNIISKVLIFVGPLPHVYRAIIIVFLRKKV